MQVSISAADPAFTTFTYNGRVIIKFLDHNDEYDLAVHTGDEFLVKVKGSKVELITPDLPEVKFRTTTVDPLYVRLMKNSTSDEFVFTPHPKFPAYPFIPQLKFEMLPQLYAYFNKNLFNNKCPERLLFKRTNGKNYGMAHVATVKGENLYRLWVNLKLIAGDPIIFIDTLLHEMIHLFLMRRGKEENDRAALFASHGPLFQAEMRRLNKLGYNIDLTLDWEKRQDVFDEVSYMKAVAQGTKGQTLMLLAWSPTNLDDYFEAFQQQVHSEHSTSTLDFTLGVSTDAKVRNYLRFPKSGKLPKTELKKWYENIDFKGRVLSTKQLQPGQTAAKFKIKKADEPYYAAPFPIFVAYMRRQYPTTWGYDTPDEDFTNWWKMLEPKKILPYAEEELKDIYKAIKRGLADAEIRRMLNAVYARFDGRMPYSEYRTSIRNILTKHKLEPLADYSQLKL